VRTVPKCEGGLNEGHTFKWGYLEYEAIKSMKDAHDPSICFIPVPLSLAGLGDNCIILHSMYETPIVSDP
jgi:hypothetical protein